MIVELNAACWWVKISTCPFYCNSTDMTCVSQKEKIKFNSPLLLCCCHNSHVQKNHVFYFSWLISGVNRVRFTGSLTAVFDLPHFLAFEVVHPSFKFGMTLSLSSISIAASFCCESFNFPFFFFLNHMGKICTSALEKKKTGLLTLNLIQINHFFLSLTDMLLSRKSPRALHSRQCVVETDICWE